MEKLEELILDCLRGILRLEAAQAGVVQSYITGQITDEQKKVILDRLVICKVVNGLLDQILRAEEESKLYRDGDYSLDWVPSAVSNLREYVSTNLGEVAIRVIAEKRFPKILPNQ